MEVYESSPKFCLTSSADVEKMRRLEGCESVRDRLLCETSAPVPEPERNCLIALIQNGSSSHHCDINEYEVDEESDVTFDRGYTGLLVNFPSAFTVYGTTLNGHKERILLSPPTSVDLRTCLFVPGRYSTIQLLKGKKEITIRQQLRLHRDPPESTSEAVFYPLEAPQWNDEEILSKNITLQDIEEMIRENVAHPIFVNGHSFVFYATWAMALGLIFCVLALVYLYQKNCRTPILSNRAVKGTEVANE